MLLRLIALLLLVIFGSLTPAQADQQQCPDGGQYFQGYGCGVPVRHVSKPLYCSSGTLGKCAYDYPSSYEDYNYTFTSGGNTRESRVVNPIEPTWEKSGEFSIQSRETSCVSSGCYTRPWSSPPARMGSWLAKGLEYDECPTDLYPEHNHGPLKVEGADYCFKPKTQPQICEANPVSVADGVKLHQETIYTGYGQHPLTLKLFYSSELQRWSSRLDLYLDVANKKLREMGGQYVQYEYAGEFSLHGMLRKVWKAADSQNLLFEDTAGYWQLQRDNSSFEVYNEVGYLQQVSFGAKPTVIIQDENAISLQPSGVAHNYKYTGNKISQLLHTNGDQLIFSWAGERVSSTLDSASNEYRFSYNLQGMLNQINFPDGSYKTYHYEDSRKLGALTGISLKGVRYAWYSYNEQGRAIESRHFEGTDKHSFEYSAAQTKVTNPLDKLTTYHYTDLQSDKLARIERQQSSYCAGGAQVYSYDSQSRKETVTDWNGNTTRFTYYDNDKIAIITEADGTALARQTLYEWQPEGNKLTAIERDGMRQSFSYDTRGNLTAETLASNGTSRTTSYSYEYYDNHIIQTLTVTDANNQSVVYSFDNQGNLLTETGATGELTTYAEYDSLGNVGKISYPDGTALTLSFDKRGKVLTEQYYTSTDTDMPYQSNLYSYNRFGKINTLITTPGSTTQYFYDVSGRLVAEQKLLNGTTTVLGALVYQRDKLGNIVSRQHFQNLQLPVSYCSERTTPAKSLVLLDPILSYNRCSEVTGISENFRQHYAYTELGKLREISDADGAVIASYSYDANGNLTATTDAQGNSTSFSYDALNRLISEQAPDNSITEYNWQGDSLSKVTDSRDNATEYQLSALQDVTRQLSPDSGNSGYEYDAAGNVIATTDARGIRTGFSWDGEGRLLNKTNSSVHNWLYDVITGQLTDITDDSGSTSWQYNSAGQLSSQTAVIDGSSYALSWAYDSYQRPSSLTYPGGNQVAYQYNTANQLTAVTVTINGQQLNLLSNISTLPYGPIAGWEYGNGLNRSYSYDLNYRLTGISTPGVQQLAYSYANGQISAISNQLNSAQSQSFSYDNLSRLTTVSSSADGQDDYSYDSLGNRLSRSGNVSESYDIDPLSNRLLTVSRGDTARQFSYDANGNVISETGFDGSVRSYGYNDDNRLITVDSISAGNSTYQYNALGQRVAKTVDGVSTHFIYSPQGPLLAEGNSKQYIYVYGQLVGYINNNQLYYVHNDHLGRPEVITDQSKTIVWQAKLDAFDRSVLSSSIGDFNIGFPGQYWDEEKQSWYNYFRDYDATTGRYLQSDPLGLFDGPNTYGYVRSNPVNYVDPTGLVCISPDAKNGITGFSGGTASALVNFREPRIAIALGLINGTVGYFMGPEASGAVTGAIAGGFSRRGFSTYGSSVGFLMGGLSGWEGTALGGMAGGLTEGILNPDFGRYGGNNWTRSGGASLVRGGLAGLAGGLANQGAGWVVDEWNKEQGICTCANPN